MWIFEIVCFFGSTTHLISQFHWGTLIFDLEHLYSHNSWWILSINALCNKSLCFWQIIVIDILLPVERIAWNIVDYYHINSITIYCTAMWSRILFNSLLFSKWNLLFWKMRFGLSCYLYAFSILLYDIAVWLTFVFLS